MIVITGNVCAKFVKLQELREKRQDFVTERAIQQYLGLIRNNFSLLQSEKHKGTPRDRKLFYQVTCPIFIAH